MRRFCRIFSMLNDNGDKVCWISSKSWTRLSYWKWACSSIHYYHTWMTNSSVTWADWKLNFFVLFEDYNHWRLTKILIFCLWAVFVDGQAKLYHFNPLQEYNTHVIQFGYRLLLFLSLRQSKDMPRKTRNSAAVDSSLTIISKITMFWCLLHDHAHPPHYSFISLFGAAFPLAALLALLANMLELRIGGMKLVCASLLQMAAGAQGTKGLIQEEGSLFDNF